MILKFALGMGVLILLGMAGAAGGSPVGIRLGAVGIAGLSLLLYFLPALIASGRKHSNVVPITVLNPCLGWTLVGWVAALVWAYTVPPAATVPLAVEPVITPLPSAGASIPAVAHSSLVSVADELMKLATLHEKGVLTDEEFAAQKAKVMARA